MTLYLTRKQTTASHVTASQHDQAVTPDLNPIEHAWAKLKERIYMLYPNLELFSGTKEQLKEQFYKAMEDAWESLGQELFNGLVMSMENRVNAVLEAKGWYTHY